MGRLSVHKEKNLESRIQKSKRRKKTITELQRHIDKTYEELEKAVKIWLPKSKMGGWNCIKRKKKFEYILSILKEYADRQHKV